MNPVTDIHPTSAPGATQTSGIGFRTGSLRQPSTEQAAAELARMGYDCLELCLESADVRPDEMTEARARALLRYLDDLGIGLASLSYHADREPPDQRAANQARAIQVAQWMGAEVLILNGERSTDQERQWAEHVERLAGLCELAEPAGVILAIEPEPLLVIGSSQDGLAMIEAVGSPALKVNLDVGHAAITDSNLAHAVRLLGDQIVHLHLEDIAGRVHRHLPFGAGDIHFGAIRQALAEIGYSGPYVVDLFGQDMDPLQVAADALAAMRRIFA
jgi:sugar phosphate isomerase/epimerase